jgi:hypothetical protein
MTARTALAMVETAITRLSLTLHQPRRPQSHPGSWLSAPSSHLCTWTCQSGGHLLPLVQALIDCCSVIRLGSKLLTEEESKVDLQAGTVSNVMVQAVVARAQDILHMDFLTNWCGMSDIVMGALQQH